MQPALSNPQSAPNTKHDSAMRPAPVGALHYRERSEGKIMIEDKLKSLGISETNLKKLGAVLATALVALSILPRKAE